MLRSSRAPTAPFPTVGGQAAQGRRAAAFRSSSDKAQQPGFAWQLGLRSCGAGAEAVARAVLRPLQPPRGGPEPAQHHVAVGRQHCPSTGAERAAFAVGRSA